MRFDPAVGIPISWNSTLNFHAVTCQSILMNKCALCLRIGIESIHVLLSQTTFLSATVKSVLNVLEQLGATRPTPARPQLFDLICQRHRSLLETSKLHAMTPCVQRM